MAEDRSQLGTELEGTDTLTPEEVAKALRRRRLRENELWVKRVIRDEPVRVATEILLNRLSGMEPGWEREHLVAQVGRELAGAWGDDPNHWLAAQDHLALSDDAAVETAIIGAFTVGIAMNAPYDFVPVCEDVVAAALSRDDALLRNQAMEQLASLGDVENVLLLAEYTLADADDRQVAIAIHGYDRLLKTQASLERLSGKLELPRITDNLLRDGHGGYVAFRTRACNQLVASLRANVQMLTEVGIAELAQALKRLGCERDLTYVRSLVRQQRPDLSESALLASALGN